MDIKKKIKSLPTQPGVYLMKDKVARVIYVGKAANIKKRVLSYFAHAPVPLSGTVRGCAPRNSVGKEATAEKPWSFTRPRPSYKNEVLLKQVCDIQTITTSSEHEAFLLESRLIKQLRPRYNVSLKDDKSFPFIKITRQDFPRLFIGRKKPKEDVQYLGPYTNAKFLRLTLKSLRKAFPFCSCHKFPKKECLDFHLGLCSGPCIGKISKRDYRKNIQDFKLFLRKGSASLVRELKKRMHYYAKIKKFEEAIKLREKIKALGLISKQSRLPGWEVLGLEREPRRIEAFDISNIGGSEAVGSMVTFLDGKPCKDNYRRFRIRLIEGIDDYKMIREVLGRRYLRVIREDLDRPDLIVIDGGKGHLNVALKQLKDLGLDIPIIAIAKDEELIYTVTKERPVKLDRENHVLQLIQRLRDEAHRFAIKYHKLLRKKKVFERQKKE